MQCESFTAKKRPCDFRHVLDLTNTALARGSHTTLSSKRMFRNIRGGSFETMASFRYSVRHGLVALGAVAVLGGAAVGIAAAQTQPATPAAGQTQSGYQKFIDALAQRLGTTTAKLESAIGQARADAGLPAGGQGFPFGPGGRGKGGPLGGGIDLNAAATAIGITPQQLHTELSGKSLADVAKAHGKTAADVATALKNAAHTRIDQAVTAGRLTADQANTLKAQADQRIDQLVNQPLPQGGPGGPRGGFDEQDAA